MRQKKRKARNRTRPRRDISSQEALVIALTHPVRVKALTIFAERTASPKEISEELGIEISNAAYHVRVLEELGLVDLVEEESVGGSVAHFYKAVRRDPFDNPDWKRIDPKTRSAFSTQTLEALLSDLAASLSAGTFDQRDDRHLSRTPLLLDEKGWRRVLRIQASALKSILDEQAAATGRMNGSREMAIRAMLEICLFELSPETAADE